MISNGAFCFGANGNNKFSAACAPVVGLGSEPVLSARGTPTAGSCKTGDAGVGSSGGSAGGVTGVVNGVMVTAPLTYVMV